METAEIKKLSDVELKEKISSEKMMLTKLKLQHAVSPIESPIRIRTQRKMMAQLLTEASFRKKKAPVKAVVAAKEAAPKKAAAPKKVTAKKVVAKSAPAKKSK